MASSIYATGTVSVSNGNAVVTGSGTAWAVSLVTGGMFSCAGSAIPILSVESDTSLTLAYPWSGSTAGGALYAIDRGSSQAANVVDLFDKMSMVIRQLGLAGIHPSASGTIADRDAIVLGVDNKGFIFLYAEVGFDLAFYRWSGTAWQGPFAIKGNNGMPGQSAAGASGYRYVWDTGTTAADPGAGKIRLNNATLNAATALYISETTDQTQAIAGFIATWDDSTAAIKGTLRIIKEIDPSVFFVYSVSGVLADNGAWDTLTVAYLAGSGALASGDRLRLEFTRNGDVGPIGQTGAVAMPTLTYSSTITDADPGAGLFRFDNATIASVTKAFVDNTAIGGGDITAWLDSFDDATSVVKGILHFQGVTTTTAGAVFLVNGSVVDGTGYRKLTLARLSSWGTWTNGHVFAATFVRTGDKGDPTGYRQAFSTTTTDADPGNGIVRANNATFGSVTQLFADNLDAAGASITAWLDGLSSSTTVSHKGYLRLSAVADPTIYQEYVVTGAAVDGTGYRKLPVSPVASAGTLTNGMALVLTFTRTGDKGADGVGVGDIVGPSSAVADRIARFNGTTGKLIKDGGLLLTADYTDASVTLAKIANIATARLLGRTTAGSGVVEEMTAATAKTLLAIAMADITDASANGRSLVQAANYAAMFALLKQAATTSATGATELAVAAEYLANTSGNLSLTPAEVWAAAAVTALTDAATVVVDFSAGIDFGGASNAVLALGGNRTLGAPSNVKSGQKGILWFGAATSTRTLTLDAAWVLCTGVEAGPYSVLTTGVLGVAYVVRGTTIYVTTIIRIG